MASRATGRPSKLTDKVREKIAEDIRNGNYAEVAARASGVSASSYYRWMEKGEADEERDLDTPHRKFRDEVLRAAAEAETRALKILHDAMSEDPRLVLPWAERRFPDRWHKRQRLELDPKSETESVYNRPVYIVPPEEQREEIARYLAEAMGIDGSRS